VYGEDKKYGYDKDGNSLNPVDIEKRKRKEDDLFGAPNKKKAVKEESQAKQEISDLKKAAKTLKGKYVAKADKVEEDKNWIQKAVKRPGAFTAKANKHDMSVQGFAKYVDDNPKKFDTRTKRQANLAQTFASMKKEDMDEMIEILGDVLLEG
jgi:predicted HNH restriction endonuclease